MTRIGGNKTERDRHPSDYYPTPPEATRFLMDRVKFTGTILEPAAGSGHMTKVIESYGYSVESNDISWGTDFFKRTLECDNIITNPPYRCSLEFVEHALKICSGDIWLLMPIGFMTSKKRLPLLRSNNLYKVLIITNRLKIDTHYGVISSQFNHVWYGFNRSNRLPPILEFGETTNLDA